MSTPSDDLEKRWQAAAEDVAHFLVEAPMCSMFGGDNFGFWYLT